jgi:hypothetical protein
VSLLGPEGAFMIDPAEIPGIDGDMDELAQFADGFEITGYEVADTGAGIHRSWQALAGVYDAPDADQLFAATGPVQSGSASVGEDIPVAGKGTLEIWQISPTKRIVYRDFSTSGAQGQGAHETIDVHDVLGLDGVRRSHIPGG